MKDLTKAEEQVMQVIWDKQKTTVKDILAEMPHPKPAVNTVSTIVRILETKGFVGHEAFGRGYIYLPLISKPDYTRKYMQNFLGGYFGNSFKELVSFFARDQKMDLHDLELMMQEIKNDLKEE